MSKKIKEEKILNNLDSRIMLRIRRKYLYLFIFAKLTKFKVMYSLAPFFSTLMKGIYHLVLTKGEVHQMNIVMIKSLKRYTSQYRSFLLNKIKHLYGNEDLYKIYDNACRDIVEMVCYSSNEYFRYDMTPDDFNIIYPKMNMHEFHVKNLSSVLSGEFIICSRLIPMKTKEEIISVLNNKGIVYIPEEFADTKDNVLEFAKLMLSKEELREEGLLID
jgi:hypothetical protein